MLIYVCIYTCISSPIYSDSIRIIKYSGNTNNLGFQVTAVRNLRKLNRQHVQHQRILIHVDMACNCHDMQGKEIWILLGGLITFISRSTAHTFSGGHSLIIFSTNSRVCSGQLTLTIYAQKHFTCIHASATGTESSSLKLIPSGESKTLKAITASTFNAMICFSYNEFHPSPLVQ